jgi:hypothetical protein
VSKFLDDNPSTIQPKNIDPLEHKGPLLGRERPSGGFVERVNFSYGDAFLLPTAVTITIIIHPARAMVRDAGSADNGTDNTANDRARRPCDDGTRARSDCHAGESSLILRTRGEGKGGQGRECRSDTKDKNFTHDRLSSFPGA